MKLRLAAFAATAGATAFVLLACHGQTLDLGSMTDPNSAPLLDTGPSNAPGPDVVDTGSRIGLFVDGIECTSVTTDGQAYDWPAYRVVIRGQCGVLGDANGVVESRADLPYPQACSVATAIYFGFSAVSDAHVIDFNANVGAGACAIASGPSTANASEPLTFYGTVVRGGERHTIWYGAAGSALPPPNAVSDAGDSGPDFGIDSSIDVSIGPDPACEPVPAWYQGRPTANACPGRPPRDADSLAGDECTSDSDCASGVCDCSPDRNLCLTNSNCRVDSDCATGRCVRSSPYPNDVNAPRRGDELYRPGLNRPHTEAVGYFCTTPNDNCCSLGSGYCTYDWDEKRWDWGYGP